MIRRSALASASCKWLSVGLCGIALLGCKMHSSGQREAEKKRAPTARLDEGVLSNLGLETAWFLPSADTRTTVLSAVLDPDGLFLSTQAAAGRSGQLIRVQPKDGHVAWYFDLEHDAPLTQAPTVHRYGAGAGNKGNEVFFTQLDDIYVVDLVYGDLMRRADLDSTVATSVAAVDDLYFFGAENGTVLGYLKAGDVAKWQYRTGVGLRASPVVSGSSVLFASQDHSVYRFSATQGYPPDFFWSRKTGGPVVASPTVFSDRVYVGSTDYKLYCLSLRDGSVIWPFLAEAPIETPPVVYSPQAGAAVVYCISVEHRRRGEKRTLFAAEDHTGLEAWRHPGIRQVVARGRDNLYVLADPAEGVGRKLLALDAKTGKQKFELDISQFHFVPTNSADFGRDASERGRFYLVGRDGAVQAITEKY